MTDPLSGMDTANQSLQHVYKAKASNTEEEVTSTGGLLLKRRILTMMASKVNTQMMLF